jgi:hypothetical protein
MAHGEEMMSSRSDREGDARNALNVMGTVLLSAHPDQ